jgi:hypothetical protein
MKLLSKLRELRNTQATPMEVNNQHHQPDMMGLGTVTVHDIVRLHAEMAIYERLYQQRVER